MTEWSVTTKIDNGKIVIKPRSEWNTEERKAALSNFTALYSIQYVMDDRKFVFIASSESAKEAWDTLQMIFEGSRCKDLKKEGDVSTLKRDWSISRAMKIMKIKIGSVK